MKTATQAEHGTFAGELQGYSLQEGELQPLLKVQHAEFSVCVIDFDKDRALAVQAANSMHLMLRGRTTLIALSQQSDPTLIVEAMRAGCSEYLAKPLSVEASLRIADQAVRAYSGSQDVKVGRERPWRFSGLPGRRGNHNSGCPSGIVSGQTFSKKVLIVDEHQHLGHVALYLGQDAPSYDFLNWFATSIVWTRRF